MVFTITAEQSKVIDKWLHEVVYPPILKEQKQDPFIANHIFTDQNGRSYPYEGAMGGGLTYSFTPTGLGTIVKVSYGDKELDITDFENW